MSWLYEIALGRMRDPDGYIVGFGYSGNGEYKNHAAYAGLHNLGPIPQGIYRIGTPVDTVTHGPYVLPLSPEPDNDMHGRSGFLIHGDSVIAPGTASEGCIILNSDIRHLIGKSTDSYLTVVSGVPVSDEEVTA